MTATLERWASEPSFLVPVVPGQSCGQEPVQRQEGKPAPPVPVRRLAEGEPRVGGSKPRSRSTVQERKTWERTGARIIRDGVWPLPGDNQGGDAR